MRVLKRVILYIMLISICTSVSAIDLSSVGATVISETKEGNKDVIEAADEDGNTFTLITVGELTGRQSDFLREVLSTFYYWSTMDVSVLRITLTDDRASILIIPARFEFSGVDLAQFMPAGMQFYIDRILEYDFRLKLDTIFVRLRGQFFDESQFVARLVDAIENPAAFIERNDPEYVLRKLREIDDSLISSSLEDEALNKRIDALITAVADADRQIIEALKLGLERLRKEAATLVADYEESKRIGAEVIEDYFLLKDDFLSLKEAHEQLTEDFEQHKTEFADYAELREAEFAEYVEQQAADFASHVEQQNERNAELAATISTLRYGFLAEANKSFFGKLRPIEEETVARILEIKSENPSITAKDIVSQLKSEGIAASNKEVALVLLAFLGIVEE